MQVRSWFWDTRLKGFWNPILDHLRSWFWDTRLKGFWNPILMMPSRETQCFLKTVLSRKLLAMHTAFPSCHDRPPWVVNTVCYIKNYIISKTCVTLHLNSLKSICVMHFALVCLFLISGFLSKPVFFTFLVTSDEIQLNYRYSSISTHRSNNFSIIPPELWNINRIRIMLLVLTILTYFSAGMSTYLC